MGQDSQSRLGLQAGEKSDDLPLHLVGVAAEDAVVERVSDVVWTVAQEGQQSQIVVIEFGRGFQRAVGFLNDVQESGHLSPCVSFARFSINIRPDIEGIAQG